MSESTPEDPPKTPDAPPVSEDPKASEGEIPVEVVPADVPETKPAVDWEAKVASLEAGKKENWDRYLRAAADLENLRKRTKRELEDAKYDAKTKTLKEMLPVVDNLERAIEHAASGGTNNPIVEGVQLVLRQFTTAFERLDVVAVDALNQPFDPNLHEAISQQETAAQPAGTVMSVLQKGYKLGERLLRPALVVVAKAPAEPPAPSSDPPASGEAAG